MLHIVRNDLVKMEVDAIVNTANSDVAIGRGCDAAVYAAAGMSKLMAERIKIGPVPEGEVFITPGFNLPSKYIIHAVSPMYLGEESESLIALCYMRSMKLASENNVKSIAFPLISTGSYGCPKEIGLRLAIDSIKSSPFFEAMEIYLVVFDPESVALAENYSSKLKSYIDDRYFEEQNRMDVMTQYSMPMPSVGSAPSTKGKSSRPRLFNFVRTREEQKEKVYDSAYEAEPVSEAVSERLKHLSDPFGTYLIYLIDSKGMNYADVYKRAIVDKKVFSKIKNNPGYHPNKTTALCLCIGAMLNLDESRDLLARAGYAISPSDKTDIIFSYFIEHGIYDMIELDIILEEYGLPCIIN